jgi:hypothetical protein
LSAMRRIPLLLPSILAAILLSPAAAIACPYCAGNAKSGIGSAIVLVTFVLLPFAVVYAVYKFIRSERQEGPKARLHRLEEHAFDIRGFGSGLAGPVPRTPFAHNGTRRESE